jgi:predicted amidohydrolase YtcJ
MSKYTGIQKNYVNIALSAKDWTRILKSNNSLQWTNVKKETGQLVYGFKTGYIVVDDDPLFLRKEFISTLRIVGTSSFKKSISGYIERHGK